MIQKYTIIYDSYGFPFGIAEDGLPVLHLNPSAITCENIYKFVEMLNRKEEQ